jgi:uncharacterized protein (TIGR02598 family)
MKLFSSLPRQRRARGGFNLVEATFSIGIVSCGFLTLIPLLSTGMHTARLARNDRITGQIAQTMIEEAKLNALPAGVSYFTDQGAACGVGQAAFTVQTTTQSMPVSLTQLTLFVTPVGAPDHARTYAVVFPAQQ